MRYELRKVIPNGAIIDGDGDNRSQNITIVTGIVDDIYDFTRTDTYIAFGSRKMTIEEFQADVEVQAAAFVATTYLDK